MISRCLGYLYISIPMFQFELDCKVLGLQTEILLRICGALSTMCQLHSFYTPSRIAVKVFTNTCIIEVELIYTNNICCTSCASKCISGLFVFISFCKNSELACRAAGQYCGGPASSRSDLQSPHSQINCLIELLTLLYKVYGHYSPTSVHVNNTNLLYVFSKCFCVPQICVTSIRVSNTCILNRLT